MSILFTIVIMAVSFWIGVVLGYTLSSLEQQKIENARLRLSQSKYESH